MRPVSKGIIRPSAFCRSTQSQKRGVLTVRVTAAAVLWLILTGIACAQIVGILGKTPPIRTAGGSAPTAVDSPAPADASNGVATSGTITWGGCVGATAWTILGPDTTNPPTTFTSLGSASKSFTGLSNNTAYYWKPTCANAFGSTSPAAAYSFIVVAGPVPGTPSNPSPADTATGIAASVTVSCSASGVPTSWTILGPDTTNPPTTNHAGLSTCSWAASGLSNSTTYYWKATATNGSGSTAGPVWSFTTAAGGALATLSASDVTYLGMMRVASNGHCYSGGYGRIAMRYVGGVRHVLIAADANNSRLAPCEFVDTAVYDSAGTCTANCPAATLGTSPTLASYGNWGYDSGGIGGGVLYDFYHGKLGACYGNGTLCGTANGSTLMNDCSWSGGGGCELTDMFIVPGSPDRLYFTYGAAYGSNYHDQSLGFVTLDTTPQDGVNGPATTAYGPFNPDVAAGQTPNDPTHYTGLHAAQRLLKLPDGTYAFSAAGGGASFGNGFGSSGPTLWKVTDGLPTTSTSSAYGSNVIHAATKYLHYYNMSCHDATVVNCGGTQHNADGSLPAGRPIWAFRNFNYQYVRDGSPCAINADNPVGMPLGCGPPTNYDYVSNQSPYLNPQLNGGVGTWGDLDRLGGTIWFQGTSKQGVLVFAGFATNHLAGNTTACTAVIGGVTQNVAHTSYCDGQYKGASGFTCSGALPGYGHPGDTLSPQYQCQYVDIAVGPSDTFREPAILIFNPDDLTAVASSSKTDYTVDPVATIYPLTDLLSTMPFAPTGTNGVAMSWGGCVQDPNNIHVVYCTAPQADNTTHPGYPDVVIHAFKIAG